MLLGRGALHGRGAVGGVAESVSGRDRIRGKVAVEGRFLGEGRWWRFGFLLLLGGVAVGHGWTRSESTLRVGFFPVHGVFVGGWGRGMVLWGE